MRETESTGGLVITDNFKVLFIFKRGKWDLPKGRVENKANIEECALREISEEAGLRKKKLEIVNPLIPTYHLTRHNGTRYSKKTHWYLVHYRGELTDTKPQVEEGIVAVKWFDYWDLKKPLSNAPLRIHYLIDYWLKRYAYRPKD